MCWDKEWTCLNFYPSTCKQCREPHWILPSQQRIQKLRFMRKLGYQKPCWDQARLSSLRNNPSWSFPSRLSPCLVFFKSNLSLAWSFPYGLSPVCSTLVLYFSSSLSPIWSVLSLVFPHSGLSSVWSFPSLVFPQSGVFTLFSHSGPSLIRSFPDQVLPWSGPSPVWSSRLTFPVWYFLVCSWYFPQSEDAWFLPPSNQKTLYCRQVGCMQCSAVQCSAVVHSCLVYLEGTARSADCCMPFRQITLQQIDKLAVTELVYGEGVIVKNKVLHLQSKQLINNC